MIDDPRAELAKMIYALSQIKDILETPDPRYPSFEWYKTKLDHIGRIIEKCIPGDCNDE
jgi:hypothetical protein